jgi:FtsP/CotA-like multicopper oxidase with cupredoxin domain
MFRIRLVLAALLVLCLGSVAHAQVCSRPAPGSVAVPSADLYSAGGVLNVSLSYFSSTDADGRTLYCFLTPDGIQSPTLHVNPGDTLTIAVTNKLSEGGNAGMSMPIAAPCGDTGMSSYSVNLHFHGLNATPVCHSDETIRTIVNPGSTFTYSVSVPADEPPGLYWYHPHVHGISHEAVLGGATGALVVEGIESQEPKVAGLPERVVIVRDQQVAGNPNPGGIIPSYDVSLDYTPVSYPALTPATLEIVPGRREFWRVLNASADLIADLQLTYDGVPQPLEVVALDGVALGSQDGTRHGHTQMATHLLMPPAARAELIMTSPPPGVHRAVLETLKIHGGKAADNNTHRVLAVLAPENGAMALRMLGGGTAAPARQRFEGLEAATVTAHRRLYFSELGDGRARDRGAFFITVDGQPPQAFDPAAPPAITTTQGAVEDWTIENRTLEVHEFHIHQIHFQLRKISGVPVPAEDRQFRDTVQVPYWTGTGPYPSVTVRMDFRGNIAGDFVYHCHILDHEDLGMMAKIRVLPSPQPPAPK